MTSSIYSTIPTACIQSEKKEYQQQQQQQQQQHVQINNVISSNTSTSTSAQSSIDLLTASTKFVPSSMSSSSSSSSTSSTSGKMMNSTNMNTNKMDQLDMEDIDSNDDMYDDDLMDCENNQMKFKSNTSNSLMNSTNQNLNNIPNMTEDDKRKRRAIANSNERRRMQSINAGFQNLKALIPHSSGEKLSKACILQRSADYMQYLSNEKDKITNKLQIAIKLIESNGLLSQLQAQINLSLAETNQSNATSTTTTSVTKLNRNQKQTTQDNTNCSNQNQTNETSNNEKSNTNTKISNISTTPASVASNRKSFSSSPSASFHGSPDRNETKLDQQSFSTPIDETLPSSVPSTTSNPISSIINLKGKTNESEEINPLSPNNKESSSVAIETAYLKNVDNNDQNMFTMKSQLLNEEASNIASNDKNTAALFSSSTSPNSNVICRQLSDTTNIISFSDSSLIVLNNNNNNINNTLNANAISNNTQITTSSVQLNLTPNESSCSFSTSADLKGNNSNLFACGGTLIQSLNPIGCLSSLQHSQILATTNVPNSNEQSNTVTNNNSNLNSKQIQLEFDNSKKISNLLRCTDLLNVSLATSGSNLNKKHIKQMVQMGQPTYAPPLNQVNQANDLDLQKVSATSHIQISNADLAKLIEYKIYNESNQNTNNTETYGTKEYLLKLLESLKSTQSSTQIQTLQLLNPKLEDSCVDIKEGSLNENEFDLRKNDINNNNAFNTSLSTLTPSKTIKTSTSGTNNLVKKSSSSNKINKLNEQNENMNQQTNENYLVKDFSPSNPSQLNSVSVTNTFNNTIKNLTSSPLVTNTVVKSPSSNKIRHISQLEQKTKTLQSPSAIMVSTTSTSTIQSQNKNINQYLSSLSPNSQQSSQQQTHLPSVLNNKTYLVKTSRSNSIDQLIAAAAVTGLPSANSTSNSNDTKEQSISNLIEFEKIPSVITDEGPLKANKIEIKNTDSSLNELSVSRKNLNTIVEAIFHVEGNLIYSMEDEIEASSPKNPSTSIISCNDKLDNEASIVMMPSSSCDATSSTSCSSSTGLAYGLNQQNLATQFLQLQKPPKKRKYTTEDITQTLPHHLDEKTLTTTNQENTKSQLTEKSSNNNLNYEQNRSNSATDLPNSSFLKGQNSKSNEEKLSSVIVSSS